MHRQLKEVPCQSTQRDNYGRAFLDGNRLLRVSFADHIYSSYKVIRPQPGYLSRQTEKQLAPTHARHNQAI